MSSDLKASHKHCDGALLGIDIDVSYNRIRNHKFEIFEDDTARKPQ